MPRIYDFQRDPIDFCIKCFPEMKTRYNPKTCDINADHPSYNDTDYECEKCHSLLTEKDN
jgi:hypothetical protein